MERWGEVSEPQFDSVQSPTSVAAKTACCRSEMGASRSTVIVAIPCGPLRRIGTDILW